MMLCPSTISFALLIFVAVAHFVAGVEIDTVGLGNGKPYVLNNAIVHIKFNLTMEANETLQSVKWQKNDGTGQYEWTPDGIPQVSGIFVGVVNSSIPNGELSFSSAKLKFAGNYTLNVTTNLGSDTANYNLIVYYQSLQSISYNTYPITTFCKLNITMRVESTAPYPNISCAFDVDIGGKTVHVPLEGLAELKVNITNQENGTFYYQMKSSIPNQNIPMESSFVCNFWIQDSDIFLTNIKPSVTAQPCPEPVMKTNLTYAIIAGYKSCYGGYTQSSRANYSCTDTPDLEPHKTLECRKKGMWEEINKTPWPACNEIPTCENCDPGTGVRFSVSVPLISAAFLIASYHAVM